MPADQYLSTTLPDRRRFLQSSFATLAPGVLAACAGTVSAKDATIPTQPLSSQLSPVDEFLRQAVLSKETIDRFLDPKARIWARFHPDYGYLLRNTFMRDGVDGAYTLARYDPRGFRHQVNFAESPCRINTYGDSFTQGHQVGDGETWQEVLAAHFCEPIRNYGIGGFGVYQAYRRLTEVEKSDLGAPFVILNIWGDDHHRSISAWRWLTFPPEVMESMSREMFHATPWDHVRLDPDTGQLVEKKNICPTPESLYQLCSEEFVLDTFGEDEVVHALAAMRTGKVASTAPLEKMAAAIDFKELDLSTPETIRTSVTRLHHDYATRAGSKILERLNQELHSQEKRIMVLLSYPMGAVWHHCAGQTTHDPNFVDWHPQEIRDFLTARQIPYVDTVLKHVAEHRQFQMDAKAYVDRYYIGHYNPTGNHFFAYAVKDELVNWLDPKPPAYQQANDTLIRFEGYLPG